MAKDNKERRKALIKEIEEKAQDIMKIVSDDYVKSHVDYMRVGDSIINNYIPTPFDIAKFWGIRYVYKKMPGNMPSYFKRKKLKIFISDKYKDNRYMTQLIIAHELGHFFADSDELSAMNNDILNICLSTENKKEYMANVYALYFEPRLLIGHHWEEYSYTKLNKEVYNKIFM